jgi:peptidoglycan hydrolase-like protein with peptidoglycan-binding domain
VTAPRSGERSERELAQQLQAVRSAGRRRRWPLVVIGLLVGVLATLAIGAAVRSDGDDAETVDAAGLLAVADVSTADLVSFRTYDGVLGFGAATAVSSPVDGFITSAPAVDDDLDRGDVLLHLNGEPVVVWYGDTPLFRDVGPATGAGDDVRLVEENLAVLGFDAGGTLVVDGYYDAATEQAVREWQESLSVEADGIVGSGAVTVVAGPVRVADAPVVGSSVYAGSELVQLTLLEQRATVVVAPPEPPADETAEEEEADEAEPPDDEEVEAPPAVERSSQGPVGSLPAVGVPVGDGDVVLQVGGRPVIALVDPDDVGVALIGGDTADVDRELGRSGFADRTEWAGARGIDVDTSSALFVEVPPGATIATLLVPEAADVAAGDPVLEVRASTQRVEVALPVEDLDELEIGDMVMVEFPDDTAADAVVTERSTVAVMAANGQSQPTPTVQLRIDLVGDSPSVISEGPVTVKVVDEEIPGAVVVPVRALVSLAEGGFAVEVVGQNGATRLVGVELGTFEGGVVEVTNGAVSPGDSLVVPG